MAILGRADEQKYGRWLYVQTGKDIQGFTYAPRFEYTVDWNLLQVVTATVVLVTPPTTGPTGGKLTISPGKLTIVHIWPASVCTGKDRWTAYFEVKISGGDGKSYRIFWDKVQVPYVVKGTEPDVAVIQRPGIPGLLVGTVEVESGGERVSLQTSAQAPAKCP